MTQRLALPATTFLRTLAILPARDLGVGRMAPVAVVLLMVMVMTVSTGDAAAERPATYDPQIVEYIEGLVAELGISTNTKIVGNDTWTVTTDVRLVSPGKYHVDTTSWFGDEAPKQVSYEIQTIEVGTYRIIIEDLESDVTYTDVAEVIGGGSGSSENDVAQISLFDKKYGSVGTRLSDSYTGCTRDGGTYGDFTAQVKSDHLFVHWNTRSAYYHLCFVPIAFTHVVVNIGGSDVRYDSSHNNWYHKFDNRYYNEPSWHMVEVTFYYSGVSWFQ